MEYRWAVRGVGYSVLLQPQPKGFGMSTTTIPGFSDAQSSLAPADNVRSIGKSRVQFDLSPRAMKLLIDLKDKTEAASYAEVFKNALKLYDGLIGEAERGGEFLVRDKDGKVSTLKLFL